MLKATVVVIHLVKGFQIPSILRHQGEWRAKSIFHITQVKSTPSTVISFLVSYEVHRISSIYLETLLCTTDAQLIFQPRS